MECYCCLRNVQDLSDGKTPHEKRFGYSPEGPMIPFGSMVEYHPFLRRTSQDSINLVRKCHLDETRQNPRRKLHAKEMIMPSHMEQ